MDSFHGRLREARAKLGLTQEQFAAVAGVKKQAQSLYENGKRTPDAAYLRAISDVGADITYIVTGVPAFSDTERLRLAIEAVEEGLDALDREATADVRAGLIFAAYEVLEEHGEKATAQIIRLVKAA